MPENQTGDFNYCKIFLPRAINFYLSMGIPFTALLLRLLQQLFFFICIYRSLPNKMVLLRTEDGAETLLIGI
jgi:hypothetical protein